MNYGELVHSETVNGVTYNTYIEQDDLDVRGNAMASGDDAQDEAVEDKIIARLDNGDVWAWAAVTVEAEFMGLSATDHLGACCYRNTADFITSDGYYPDMKETALSSLMDKAANTTKIYRKLSKLVKA